MKAAAVWPGKKGSLGVIDIPMPLISEDHALVRTLSVGVDGTDEDINAGKYGEAPEGCDYLIIGHEGLGVIESVGKNIKCLSKGDLVVPTVRRPCLERCFSCRNHEPDMCLTDHFYERGIKGLHGFLSEYFTERLDNLIRIPDELMDVGVMLEPLSIAEKAVEQIFRVQDRMTWKPRQALVLGAGPLGMLMTFILRDMNIRTYAVATRERDSLKARIVEAVGVSYINAKEEPVETLPAGYGPFDIVIEATGSTTLAMKAREIVNNNGVVCLLGIYPEKKEEPICTSCLNMDIVMNNKLVFGSVSSNRVHFERGVDRLLSIKRKWPGLLERMITKKVPLEYAADSLNMDKEDIKSIVTFSVA